MNLERPNSREGVNVRHLQAKLVAEVPPQPLDVNEELANLDIVEAEAVAEAAMALVFEVLPIMMTQMSQKRPRMQPCQSLAH